MAVKVDNTVSFAINNDEMVMINPDNKSLRRGPLQLVVGPKDSCQACKQSAMGCICGKVDSFFARAAGVPRK